MKLTVTLQSDDKLAIFEALERLNVKGVQVQGLNAKGRAVDPERSARMKEAWKRRKAREKAKDRYLEAKIYKNLSRRIANGTH